MKTHKRRIISAALGVCMGAASVAGWSSCGAAHTNEFIEAVQASCLQEGNVAHWRCRDCGETFLDDSDFVGRHKIHIAAVRQRRTKRNHRIFVLFHLLCKLTDMVQVPTHFDVIIVDIPTGEIVKLSVAGGHSDLLSVRNSKSLFVIRRNEPNPFFGLFYMIIKPPLFIAEAVKVVRAFHRIQTKQIRILVGIDSCAVFVSVVLK